MHCNETQRVSEGHLESSGAPQRVSGCFREAPGGLIRNTLKGSLSLFEHILLKSLGTSWKRPWPQLKPLKFMPFMMFAHFFYFMHSSVYGIERGTSVYQNPDYIEIWVLFIGKVVCIDRCSVMMNRMIGYCTHRWCY